LDWDNPGYSKSIFGAGTDLVISLYLVADGPLTDGVMAVGLADGDSRTFLAGTELIIPWSSIGTTWTRFWARLPRVGLVPQDSVRLLVSCERAPVGGVITANLFDVHPGRILGWWLPSFSQEERVMRNWLGLGYGGIPVFDQQIAFDDAVALAPI
jgi:hypothetical protein